ncbi:MAG: GSCFA domain-containing protein [Muribaculaceae bacterium]|nr:GSCFA domain-containing protein [Muribaculaceae bacterium]
MPKFRTAVEPLRMQGLINHQQGVMMIGSCFSDNIGQRLQMACFDVEVNPFGTLYNPASIACAIDDIINQRVFESSDLFQLTGDNRWHSFSHHSSFSSVDCEKMLKNINEQIKYSYAKLKGASTLIVTFGTAWVYRYINTNEVVANCHKIPANQFNRQLMSVDEIVEKWSALIDNLRLMNSDLKLVFTVSPIRHLRDGAHENQISKATLHLAIDKLQKLYEGIVYFPAYEIMNDDLRDYRFYASDMTHPSEVAVDYIYDIFAQSFYSDDTMKLAVECERLYRRLLHRHMGDDQEAINRFEQSTQLLKKQMLQQYPFLQQAIEKITTK